MNDYCTTYRLVVDGACVSAVVELVASGWYWSTGTRAGGAYCSPVAAVDSFAAAHGHAFRSCTLSEMGGR